MSSKRPAFNNDKFNKLNTRTGIFDKLGKSLWEYAKASYNSEAFSNLWNEMAKASGKSPTQYKTPEDFLHKNLMKSLKSMLGNDFANDVEELVRIRFRGQFSNSAYRKSYRSRHFGFYSSFMLSRLAAWINFSCYDMSLEEMLSLDHSGISGVTDYIALEINRGNERIINIVKEMILGDNNYLLSREVIIGIILSSDAELKQLLVDLLKAAGLQEGLRQAILESADAGDRDTFLMIYKACMDNDLFRFSSAARALYTWTGLYHEDIDIKLTRSLAETGWLCLNDERKREEFYHSENPLEVYLSLWAVGCEEVDVTDTKAQELVSSDKKYLRLLGWYFISHVENDGYRNKHALKHLDEKDDEVLAHVLMNLHYNSKCLYAYMYNRNDFSPKPYADDMLPKGRAERYEMFSTLKGITEHIGKGEIVFDPSLFPWRRVTLSNENSNALKCMMSLAACDLDKEMTEELWNIREYMDPDKRRALYINFLDPEKNGEHREHLYEALSDRSVINREAVIEKLKSLEPEAEDIQKMCQLFRSKNASIKKTAIEYLKKLDETDKVLAVKYLTDEGTEYQIQAALELMESDDNLRKRCSGIFDRIKESTLSTQTEVLVRNMEEEGHGLSESNGYGLYDEEVIKACMDSLKKDIKRVYLTEKEMTANLIPTAEIQDLLDKINSVFEKHADYEYEYEFWDGTRNKVLFGQTENMWSGLRIPAEFGPEARLKNAGEVKFSMIPFHEEFEEILKPWLKEPMRYAMLQYELRTARYGGSSNELKPWFRRYHDRYNKLKHNDIYGRYDARTNQILDVMSYSMELNEEGGIYKAISDMYFSLCHEMGKEKLSMQYFEEKAYWYGTSNAAFSSGMLGNLRSIISGLKLGDDDFKDWFREEYLIERGMEFNSGYFLTYRDYLRAIELEIIPVDCLFEKLLVRTTGRANGDIAQITSKRKNILKEYPWFEDDLKRMVRNMVTFESGRGQAQTPISDKVTQIGYFEGADLFVMLLSALGRENFYRGYVWGDRTKNAVMSSLLKKCYPAEGDTAENVKAMLEKTDISEKRLVEAAMYSPQWAPVIEEIIGWKGLKRAIWFFQAHISERFSSEKETEVAIYSPVSPEKFNDGAFDINWFREVYEDMGEKRFKQLYNSAKYITEGSNAHKRSQLYTDAVRGKLDISGLEKEITEKRNQERIRAYGLIPLDEGDDRELLRRYDFINSYIKGSNAFGAQRRESERKAGRAALENLALTSGVFDVNRMLWRLEKEKIRGIQPYLERKNVLGYDLYLSFDEDGACRLITEKDGKILKNLPSQLKKDPYAAELREASSSLKEQRIRSRRTLEEAMVNRVAFTGTEIMNIIGSPTIAPMLKSLVWKHGDDLGFIDIKDDRPVLSTPGMRELTIAEKDKLIIAHPYDMKEAGVWQKFMDHLFAEHIRQPFKQVFREYYPLTGEELEEVTVSRRYAGYQVQPKKTLAVLKARGWTVDYEEGLQKVSYTENVVVRLYAEADWFSPSDVEQPTLSIIQFASRKTGEVIPLKDVDPVLFSETMRDLDLAVSTAYVGGVDPETSHSTVEMRIAIAAELVKLLKLDNVYFTERHARISGKLAEYSVHMGSGVVHAMEKGMIPILPVQSQHRGRVFLPFADEDPKTAEIMSKIILLSEDNKIKDPTILDMLR